MKNTIKLTIPFSFKGIEYAPSSVIDLDTFILGDQNLDIAYQMVANDNKIDNYSYEYEVLELASKIFSDPTGAACDFLSENHFDLEGFKRHRNNEQVFSTLKYIAKETLKIDKLEEHEMLRKALLEAYDAGRDAG